VYYIRVFAKMGGPYYEPTIVIHDLSQATMIVIYAIRLQLGLKKIDI